MTDFGLDHSFATATQKIAEHYGFDIPKSSLRKYTLGNAKRTGASSVRTGERLACAGRGEARRRSGRMPIELSKSTTKTLPRKVSR
jgi:hypothetical protein